MLLQKKKKRSNTSLVSKNRNNFPTEGQSWYHCTLNTLYSLCTCCHWCHHGLMRVNDIFPSSVQFKDYFLLGISFVEEAHNITVYLFIYGPSISFIYLSICTHPLFHRQKIGKRKRKGEKGTPVSDHDRWQPYIYVMRCNCETGVGKEKENNVFLKCSDTSTSTVYSWLMKNSASALCRVNTLSASYRRVYVATDKV